MKTITVNLYEFKELSKKVQRKALDRLMHINTEHLEWWEAIYEDAENFGCLIQGFDLYSSKQIEFSITGDYIETAKKIVENWGEESEGNEASKQYISDFKNVNKKYLEAVDKAYKSTLEKIYAAMLLTEYHYRITDEAIIETIESNEYYFNHHGEIVNIDEMQESTEV